MNGYKAFYFSMNRFIEHIATVRLDGTYTRFLNTLSKTPLLVLDDFELAQLDINMQLTLLQIMEGRYKKYHIMITSQLPVKEWHGYIGKPTIADAIMDRLTATNHRLELKGESLRKK
jgi:DNA replication protein DnaC